MNTEVIKILQNIYKNVHTKNRIMGYFAPII